MIIIMEKLANRMQSKWSEYLTERCPSGSFGIDAADAHRRHVLIGKSTRGTLDADRPSRIRVGTRRTRIVRTMGRIRIEKS